MNLTTLIYFLNIILLLLCGGFFDNLERDEDDHMKFNKTITFLRKHLEAQNRDQLIQLALAIEDYDRRANDIKRNSNSEQNFIYKLSESDLIEAIQQVVEHRPEIRSIEKLDWLVNGNLTQLAIINKERLLRIQLSRVRPESLINCYEKMLKFHNHVGNNTLVQRKKLSKTQMIDFIVEELNEHPALGSGFNSLCQEIDFSFPNTFYMEETKLKDIMFLLDKSVLRSYCLTFEEYEIRTVSGRKPALRHYLNRLNKRQLVSFLNIYLERYPTLSSIWALEQLRKEYGISLYS